MKSCVPLLLVALLAISLSGCELKTQGRPVVKPVNGPESEIVPAVEIATSKRMLGLTVDRSGSPSQSQFEELLPDLIAALRVRAESIDGVAVTWVANGNRPTLAERPKIFSWGQLEIPAYVEPNLERAPTDIRFFADRRNRYLAAAKEQYVKEKERLTTSYYSKVDNQLAKLKLYLLQGPSETAPCTRFSSIAVRLERDDYPFTVLLTDGWVDCAEERGRKLKPAKIAGKIVVLQLVRETDNANSDRAIQQREAFLRELFPDAKVLPRYSVSQAMDFLFN